MYSENPSLHNRQLDEITGSEEDLIQMIRDGEHQSQDFKFRIDSSQKIAKTISAFANTQGGRLLIGVKDNGKVAGINPEEEFYMIQGAAELYCQPKVRFETTVYSSEDKLVLEVYIPPAVDRPIKAKENDKRWLAYVRQGDENFLANRVLLHYLNDKSSAPRKNLMAYGPNERMLFEYLTQNEDISLSKFARLGKISVQKAEKILVLFLKWEVINWRATEKGIRFYLIQ